MNIQKPFKSKFLSTFVLAPDLIPFEDKDVLRLDNELHDFGQIFLSPDLEKYLISTNELLTSFAISKAENSSLTLLEAKAVHKLVLENEDYEFINKKIKNKEKLTQKDYEKLEFFNIAKTFRALNNSGFRVSELNGARIRKIHQSLTQGLDIFKDHLTHFDVYKSGKWRDNDNIRVGDYKPAPCEQIPKEVAGIVSWFKKNPSIVNLAVFHTALYAAHPFCNGNKRTCRILEHFLLRDLGLNKRNIYSTSYYYHVQKDRYYKHLLASLEIRNLNHFSEFVLESVVLSIFSVIKTSLEAKRKNFLRGKTNDKSLLVLLDPLIGRGQLQFKKLLKISKAKGTKQTLINHLKRAQKEKIIKRRSKGKNVFYRLDFSAPEEDLLKKWLEFIQEKLLFVPDEFRLW